MTAAEATAFMTKCAGLGDSMANAEVTPDWRQAVDFLAQQTFRVNNIMGARMT